MGKGRCHDRPTGGDRVDEHARRDLVPRVVRQDDDGRVLDQVRQRSQVPISGVEAHRRGDLVGPRSLNEHLTVDVSFEGKYLRVRATCDDVARPRPEILQVHHGVDGPLDALPPAVRPHVSNTGPVEPSYGTRAGGVAAPWGIITTLDGSTSKRPRNRRRAASVITTTTLAAR